MKIEARCGAGFKPAHEITIGARVENPRHILRGAFMSRCDTHKQ
jgi:hypothetical protein